MVPNSQDAHNIRVRAELLTDPDLAEQVDKVLAFFEDDEEIKEFVETCVSEWWPDIAQLEGARFFTALMVREEVVREVMVELLIHKLQHRGEVGYG